MGRGASKLGRWLEVAFHCAAMVVLLPFYFVFLFPMHRLLDSIEGKWPCSDRSRLANVWLPFLWPLLFLLVLAIAFLTLIGTRETGSEIPP